MMLHFPGRFRDSWRERGENNVEQWCVFETEINVFIVKATFLQPFASLDVICRDFHGVMPKTLNSSKILSSYLK